MGCTVSTKQKLVIATLNYSGILLSPFEFYSEELRDDEQKISSCFRKNMIKIVGEKAEEKGYKWKMGKIDQKMQRDRYTPIYGNNIGIQSGQLVDEKQFEGLWRKCFKQNIIKYDFSYSQEEKQNAFQFDLCCYKTLLEVAYKKETIDYKNTDIKPYKDLMNLFFSKSFLNEKKKIRKIFRVIQEKNIDILFIQQASNELTQKVSQKSQFYYIKADQGQSMIIVKRSRFHKFLHGKDALKQKNSRLVKDLSWNDDTTFCFIDNLILISGHLSSKKDKNPEQVQKMGQSLKQLKDLYPSHTILIGIDANSYVDPDKMKNFSLCPKIPSIPTTMKKRTWMQVQTNKAQELTYICRDFLASTLPIKYGEVQTIQGVDSKKISYLPSSAHPFDHFFIIGEVQLPSQRLHRLA